MQLISFFPTTDGQPAQINVALSGNEFSLGQNGPLNFKADDVSCAMCWSLHLTPDFFVLFFICFPLSAPEP